MISEAAKQFQGTRADAVREGDCRIQTHFRNKLPSDCKKISERFCSVFLEHLPTRAGICAGRISKWIACSEGQASRLV
jgi:hypothetical protein